MNRDDITDESYVVLIVNRFQCSKELAEKLLLSSRLNNSFESLKSTIIINSNDRKNKNSNQKGGIKDE